MFLHVKKIKKKKKNYSIFVVKISIRQKTYNKECFSTTFSVEKEIIFNRLHLHLTHILQKSLPRLGNRFGHRVRQS